MANCIPNSTVCRLNIGPRDPRERFSSGRRCCIHRTIDGQDANACSVELRKHVLPTIKIFQVSNYDTF